MEDLIKVLKDEHVLLTERFSAVKEKGIDSEESKKILFECKDALLAHLEREDKYLYPPLNEAAKNNADLKLMLDTFARDMDIISAASIDFFTKYENDRENEGFNEDISKLLAALSGRIEKEEDILYPAFEELKTN